MTAGFRFHVPVRFESDRLELGAVRPLREGVPITGELLTKVRTSIDSLA